MSGYVFISYSHGPDSVYVRRLAAYLVEAGVPVWYDEEIITGERWEQVIRGRIDGCAAFLVVMSPDADASSWIAREIHRAEATGRPIVPVLLRGAVLFRLSDLQYADVTGGRLPSSSFVDHLRVLTAAPGPGVVDTDVPTAVVPTADVSTAEVRAVQGSTTGGVGQRAAVEPRSPAPAGVQPSGGSGSGTGPVGDRLDGARPVGRGWRRSVVLAVVVVVGLGAAALYRWGGDARSRVELGVSPGASASGSATPTPTLTPTRAAPSSTRTGSGSTGGGGGGPARVPSGDLFVKSTVECRYAQFDADSSRNMLYVNFQLAVAGTQPPAGTPVRVTLYYHGEFQERADSQLATWEAGSTFGTVGIVPATTARGDSVVLAIDERDRLAEPDEANNTVTIRYQQPAGQASGRGWSAATPVPCSAG